MKTCTQCYAQLPDRFFYTIGPGRRMSECKPCNRDRKMADYTPRDRDYSNLRRDQAGRFARAA